MLNLDDLLTVREPSPFTSPLVPNVSPSTDSPGPLHPVPNLWRTQHPFHGRLTSYMACKRCERQVFTQHARTGVAPNITVQRPRLRLEYIAI